MIQMRVPFLLDYSVPLIALSFFLQCYSFYKLLRFLDSREQDFPMRMSRTYKKEKHYRVGYQGKRIKHKLNKELKNKERLLSDWDI